jgi:hypothetical protein
MYVEGILSFVRLDEGLRAWGYVRSSGSEAYAMPTRVTGRYRGHDPGVERFVCRHGLIGVAAAT